ncbi:MAG: hypothetical protein JNL26_00900 [Gemmatimonadetes bacterium]|nr:hypothetical protein [Gemmatimonadota bacterium]
MRLLTTRSLLVVLGLTACSAADSTAPRDIEPLLAKGGGGGGGTTPPPSTVLPTTPPAPGVLVRESFGFAQGIRPHGGKGLDRPVFIHESLGGFWVEWPGSKNTQWLAPNADQTWKFAACSDNPNEMPSPLQASALPNVTLENGCLSSEWFDTVTSYPTGLMPFTAPAVPYTFSMDGYPAPIPGAYIAIGFTSSSLLASNLTSVGTLWLYVRDLRLPGGELSWELRTNGMNGAVLASGTGGYPGFNPMALAYDPVARRVTLTIDGVVQGQWPFTMAAPRYLAFEGVGILDNLVLRR